MNRKIAIAALAALSVAGAALPAAAQGGHRSYHEGWGRGDSYAYDPGYESGFGIGVSVGSGYGAYAAGPGPCSCADGAYYRSSWGGPYRAGYAWGEPVDTYAYESWQSPAYGYGYGYDRDYYGDGYTSVGFGWNDSGWDRRRGGYRAEYRQSDIRAGGEFRDRANVSERTSIRSRDRDQFRQRSSIRQASHTTLRQRGELRANPSGMSSRSSTVGRSEIRGNANLRGGNVRERTNASGQLRENSAGMSDRSSTVGSGAEIRGNANVRGGANNIRAGASGRGGMDAQRHPGEGR